MRIYKICISAVLFFSLCDFAFSDDIPADLEAYRAQVLEDTTSINNITYALDSDLRGIQSFASSLANSSDQATAARGQMILEAVSSAFARTDSIRSQSLSINHVASALVLPASSNALCNCGAQLDSINTKLATILADCEWINQQLDQSYYPDGDGTENWFESVALLLYDNSRIWDVEWLQSEGKNTYYPLLVLQSLSAVSNALCKSTSVSLLGVVPGFNARIRQGISRTEIYSRKPATLSSYTNIKNLSLLGLLQEWAGWNSLALSSLNNYAYTNEVAVGSIVKTSFSALHSLTNIESRFSIFNDFVFSADAPLSMYTDKQTDGSYHDYLTNYYIKVSKGQQSGSDSFTNWFSRVELLLAALVFQDEDDSTINTNGVPSESDKNSVTQVGSSLGQTISGFVQDGNSHVSSVDTSGNSIIRMVTSWNTAIGEVAKPAPFVVAEFTAPDSQSRSNISLWLDTEDEKLSSFIEIGHGISTLAWVAVFLLLGYNLAVYSIRVLRRLISFSFSLYSAIFGGG